MFHVKHIFVDLSFRMMVLESFDAVFLAPLNSELIGKDIQDSDRGQICVLLEKPGLICEVKMSFLLLFP